MPCVYFCIPVYRFKQVVTGGHFAAVDDRRRAATKSAYCYDVIDCMVSLTEPLGTVFGIAMLLASTMKFIKVSRTLSICNFVGKEIPTS